MEFSVACQAGEHASNVTRGDASMYQDSAVPPSENPLPATNRLGLVAAQLMEAAGRVLEGDRDSAQARVARAMALLGNEPAP